MLEVVGELERNGLNLQHFCRELARYFRNLLVARIAGHQTRLIAASPAERERLAGIAAGFSEEDLTRYLQLTVDLYGDLQRSLQPRLHMELGLLRLVEAGKLLPIEEALAMLGNAPSTTPAPSAPPRKSQPPPAQGWKQKLCAALTELGMSYTADAVEHSRVAESAGELLFETPKEFRLSMKPADIQKALESLGAGAMKIKISIGSSVPAQPAAAGPSAPVPPDNDEVTGRALSHPEVQRFRETFGGQVRAVRNLKK
jgi:DNA polymerase-3 subunit gamma/tau